MIAISLGGNQEESLRWMKSAIQVFSKYLFALRVSNVYETTPLGPGTRMFYNMVIAGLSAGHSLNYWWSMCQQMEQASGRHKEEEEPWGDRILDIDILFYEKDVVSNEDLIVPHPQLHRRPFVLGPLCEIAPQWNHPILKCSAQDMWNLLQKEQRLGTPGAIKCLSVTGQDILKQN